VTAPHPDRTGTATPPPECPAHAGGLTDVTRLFGPGTESDPMGVYERLRTEHGAVAPVLLDGDVPAWLVLGYRENLEVSRTPTRFSRDSRRWRDWKEGRIAPDSPLVPMMGWRPDCVSADGEEHQRLRSAVTESLARFDRRGIRRHIHRYANQLVDRFCTRGSADLLAEYTRHLPMLVLTHLFGLPEEDGPRLVEAISELIRGTEKAVACDRLILDALRRLVELKHVSPGSDFASWLIEHPAKLTDDEIVNHLRLVLIAANETTSNLMANTLRMVLTDRRFRASLAGGHMTLPDAIEQVLWDEPPLMVCPGRWATADTVLAGQQIRDGDLLLLGLAAGNVDPAIRPDLSAPVHGNRSHLAFSGGPHECPGQDIGRAITDSGIDTLLIRLPDIRLSVPESELSWTASTWSRHLDALPVEFTPRRPAPPTPNGTDTSTTLPRPRIAAEAEAAEQSAAGRAQQPAGAAGPAAVDEPATAAARPSSPAVSQPVPQPAARPSWIRRVLGWFGHG
jgi:cytochrome P450